MSRTPVKDNQFSASALIVISYPKMKHVTEVAKLYSNVRKGSFNN